MPGEVGPMPLRVRTDSAMPIQPQHAERVVIERGGDNHPPVILHGEEPHVEGGVEVGGQEEPVVDIEALPVGLAVLPGAG